LGTVTKGDLFVDEQSFGDVNTIKNIYDNVLGNIMNN
jgi:hypothetical protein